MISPRFGVVHWEILEQLLNIERFTSFLQHLKVVLQLGGHDLFALFFPIKMSTKCQRLQVRFVAIMDNLAVHKREVLEEVLDPSSFLYIAPYSPQLNAIEEMFSFLKGNVRKKCGPF